MTLDELKKRITDHDLTFSFSDDSMVFEKGNRESKAITRAFKTLAHEDKVTIIDHWNETVSKKIRASDHDMFVWEKEIG